MEKRTEKVRKRREGMPRVYRGIYDRAVKGKSLRAAINAQCLECVGWQRIEVRNCTDLGCPLYTVRPYQVSQTGREGRLIGAELQNTGEKTSHVND